MSVITLETYGITLFALFWIVRTAENWNEQVERARG
jgi:hypothetical protein